MQRASQLPKHLLWIFGLWLAIFFASLFTPPLLDDADATHAQAAQAMLRTHDFVTLHVNGIRYLEKPPLPYWVDAGSMAVFGQNAFAVHLPLALTALGLALLGYLWSRRAFGDNTAFLTAVFTLTSTGVFLFTRIFIPDALLALLLGIALYNFLLALQTPHRALNAYAMWTALALAVLTKGFVSLVFFFGAAFVFLLFTRSKNIRALRPLTGLLLLFVIAAPWHILAGLRNTGGANGHGFFWFYFINEHVLRFLGRRIPRDYNKLPAFLYWTLHLVWLFPWSLFAPAAILAARSSRPEVPHTEASQAFRRHTTLLLAIFSGFVLIFFAVSTNQEYYTLPVYLPLLMLLASMLPQASPRALNLTFLALTPVGLAIAVALAFGLWSSHTLPYNPDIGSLLAHRGVGDYTLSMSHFFDLTGASFAALRLPATLAALAFALGPVTAFLLYRSGRLNAALLTVATTSAIFLIAAHIALGRFGPMLSSEAFVPVIQGIQAADPSTEVAIYGDQSFGSSIPFYLHQQVLLIDGRSTSMLFGSTFADAPPLFRTHNELAAAWSKGPRKLLFVPLEQRDAVDHLLGSRAVLVREFSGKALYTDRPLPATH
jgi:4-amino-4-deoxy-L-arabinose transferase-like glycosyltransferase